MSSKFKKTVIGTLAAAAAAGAAWLTVPAALATDITVYKDPNCGCCSAWEDHMRKAGFKVISKPTEDMAAVKARYGVTEKAGSCHTAVVDGYVVEGHVPADAVKKLLKERPKVTGIAVPGMPIGSPGMEQGPRKDPFDVVTFDAKGQTKVYMKY